LKESRGGDIIIILAIISLTKYFSYSDEFYFEYIKDSGATGQILMEIYFTDYISNFCSHNYINELFLRSYYRS
jgi:hypothetical protein